MPKRSFITKEVEEYRRSLKTVLMTTRFNNRTWNENQEYLQEIQRSSKCEISCIYSSPLPLAQSIQPNATVFVLEMNNEENKIMGIGLITNKIYYDCHHIYQTNKYNKFTYTGKYRIPRQENDLFHILDKLCFTGKRHQKRLTGIKQFPIDMLYNCKTLANKDLIEMIANTFRSRNGK